MRQLFVGVQQDQIIRVFGSWNVGFFGLLCRTDFLHLLVKPIFKRFSHKLGYTTCTGRLSANMTVNPFSDLCILLSLLRIILLIFRCSSSVASAQRFQNLFQRFSPFVACSLLRRKLLLIPCRAPNRQKVWFYFEIASRAGMSAQMLCGPTVNLLFLAASQSVYLSGFCTI